MKLVVTSDWHGDWVTHGVRRFEEVREAAHATVDRAIEEKAGAYAFLGDLCNPDSGSAVFRAVRLAIEVATRLSARGIPSLWVAGNHDVFEDGTGETSLTPLSGLHDENVVVCERPGGVTLEDGSRSIYFLALPFTSSAFPYEPAAYLNELPRGALPKDVVVLAHMTEIAGVEPGEEAKEMPRGRGIPLPVGALKARAAHLFNGHFHLGQHYGGVWIPGSLARLTFCEERHEPSFLVCEV